MNPIEKIISENIFDLNSVFVFPTQTAADLWADKATQVTEVSAVAMERFLAWDDFKSQSVKSHQSDRTSIPSTMRQIFCEMLLAQNAREPFLKSVIPPEYAKNASNFVNWISGILPSLSIWKAYYEHSGKKADDEDSDLLKLFELYSNFLDSHKLFDPAWEKPPFKKDGNHYYIFYPEILSDYTEYKALLENSAEDITLIHLLPQNADEETADLPSVMPKVQFYNNSRSELKAVSLQLREIHAKNKIPWDEIAISVPDLDSYGVYLDRELELYEIPHVIRASKSLASSGAGTFFVQLQNCVANDFNFESLKTLLFNTELPWKDLPLSKELIAFGQTNNCICSFVYKNQKNDIWLKSFSDNYGINPELKPYYQTIKKLAENIVNARSFEKIRTAYFTFRSRFFDMDNCPPMTDRLISRCISELGGLIDLERDFPECTIESPYKFFVNKLNSTQYLEQTDNRGVQILPYKMSAVAPFGCHVILDSSQSALSVVYKQLSFLREDKRRLLLKADAPNTSEVFIRLYAMNSYRHPAIFTCAAKTFTGYSQPTSYLEEENYISTEPEYFKEDLYLAERKSLLQDRLPIRQITQTAKDGFDFWIKAQLSSSNFNNKENNALENAKALINKKMIERRFNQDYLRVSVTHLRRFFECERSWLLYYIVNLNELDDEASLMNQFAQGTLKHKVLELFLNSLKDSGQVLTLENEELPPSHVQLLRKCITSAINDKEYGRNRKSYLAREVLSTTESALFEEMEKTITSIAFKFTGCSVYGTEQKFEYVIEEKKLLCEGTVDCLLQNPEDGGLILIDFKSTKGAIPAVITQEDLLKNSRVEYPDFQMPMYLFLLQNQKKKYPVDRCLFFNIKDGQPKEIKLEDFNPVMEKFMEALNVYEEHIRSQTFFENPKKDFSECSACAYRTICRKIFTVGKSL